MDLPQLAFSQKYVGQNAVKPIVIDQKLVGSSGHSNRAYVQPSSNSLAFRGRGLSYGCLILGNTTRLGGRATGVRGLVLFFTFNLIAWLEY